MARGTERSPFERWNDLPPEAQKVIALAMKDHEAQRRAEDQLIAFLEGIAASSHEELASAITQAIDDFRRYRTTGPLRWIGLLDFAWMEDELGLAVREAMLEASAKGSGSSNDPPGI